MASESLEMEMEPSSFPQQDAADIDLEQFLDKSDVFDISADGCEQEWVDSLLNDAFDVNFSFEDFDPQAAAAAPFCFQEQTLSNPQSSDESVTASDGNGDSDQTIDQIQVFPISDSDNEGGSIQPSYSPSPDSSSENSNVADPRKNQSLKRQRRPEETGNLHMSFNSSLMRCGGTTTPMDEDEKKKARLIRNRESAQLSRQRKKNYIDELEEKVKSMNSTISELNNTIAYLSAENVKLKQQLGLGAMCPNPNGGDQPAMAAPLAYPWPPFPAYPVMAGAMGGRVYGPGSQVPLVPIPRLRSQQPALASSKSRKSLKSCAADASSDQKPAKRIKKVASVAFLGLFLFVFFIVGGFYPLPDLRLRENRMEWSNGGLLLTGGGRVLTSWEGGNSTIRDKGMGNKYRPDFDRVKAGRDDFRHKEEFDMYAYPNGSESEPLVASLFVPRNDKLVKIDGNLIIHAVLAGEKASRADRDGKEDVVATKRETEKNSLAIITGRHRALAAARVSGRNVDIRNPLSEGAAENQRALASNSRSNYREDSKSTSVDRSIQQWFREGLAGPVLSSGMCTEVFQFDASANSPASTRNSKIMTNVSARAANSSVGQSRNNSSDPKLNAARRSGPVNMLRNRRVSYAVPLPPARPSLPDRNERNFTNHTERIHEDRGYQAKSTTPSSMVVSVLVDPRETGDEGMFSSGSLSRIFVVVLIDRVKYVTYSCVLPSKGSVPHLVRG
uniref:TSA: Wollemia nobilis Ref_Wollemi_Transcript_8194_2484 transcribed RNA sequence n=1 Tax=Wollemia nobilis TaxID=56998 RepID=A0A0C9QUR2_9CONI